MRIAHLLAAAMSLSVSLWWATGPAHSQGEKPVPFKGELGGPGIGILPERIALVIGIDRYDPLEVPLQDLKAAAKDANDVAATLAMAGFEKITKLVTGPGRPFVNRNDILQAITKVEREATLSQKRHARAPVILFFFAGHGLTSGTDDFLLPSNFQPSYAEDIPEMAIAVSTVVERLSWASPALKLILLDACRTVKPASLPFRSDPNKTSSLTPGHAGKTGKQQLAGQGVNDNLLIYSTLESQPSYEKGEENGRFTGALLDSIDEAAKVARETGTGANTDLQTIFERLKQTMDRNAESRQKPRMIVESVRFTVFPTYGDFQKEKEKWDTARALNFLPEIKITQPDADIQLRRRQYCNIEQFLGVSSYYSYFSYAALDRLKGLRDPNFDCKQHADVPIRVAVSSAPEFIKTAERGWTAAPSAPLQSPVIVTPGANSPILGNNPRGSKAREEVRVEDVLRAKEAKGELSSFSPKVPMDNIGTSSAGTRIFSAPSEAASVVGRIQENELLQIIGLKESFVQVRSPRGEVGFVPQRFVQSGRTVVKFDLHFEGSSSEVSKEELALLSVLDQVFLTDVVVHYPAEDESIGYSRAQNAAAALTRRAVAQIVPAIKSVSAEQAQLSVPLGQVRLTVGLLPLTREVRAQVASASGGAVLASRATDSVALKKAIQPADVDSTVGTVRPPVRRAPESDTARTSPSPPRRAAPDDQQVCLTTAARLKSPTKVIAYIQYPSGESGPRVDRTRDALKLAGFKLVDPGSIDNLKLTRNEVRYCGASEKDDALKAKAVLDECRLGEFAVKQVSQPVCKKARVPSIEVWIAPSTRIAKCSLKIGGNLVVDATGCNYKRTSPTSFVMNSPSDARKYEWTIVHNVDKTSADGFLTGGSSQRSRPLGKMRPEAACWISLDSSVEVCAWN